MEESKSNPINDVDQHFLDALIELPFSDCISANEPEQSFSDSSSIAQREANVDVSLKPNSSPEIISLSGLHRRRSWSHHICKHNYGNELKNSNPKVSVSFDATAPAERKLGISQNLEENEGGNEKSGSSWVGIGSKRASHGTNEESKENSTVTTANDGRFNEPTTGDSDSRRVDEPSANFIFILAGLVIRAMEFQMSLLVSFFTFPIWLLYCSFVFVMNPFQSVRHGREYLSGRLSRIWSVIWDNCTEFVYEWLKEHKSLWNLALRFGWGFMWASYVCFALVSLLVSAFVVSGFIISHFVEEPIQMKETLIFDYTKDSPIACAPIISCPCQPHGVISREKNELQDLGGPRVIPPKHKLQVTVLLTLPESDYNRKLGMFQVRLDLLSASSKTLASSSRPCVLLFKSQPIRLLMTFLKVAPLVAGYSLESQNLKVRFRGFTEGDIPTACLRVMIEQRAEFRTGGGIPEIYDASLILESEQPLPKRVIWRWKKTLFIWFGLTMFTMELLFILLCCRSIIMPRGRMRDRAANNSTTQNNRPAQR